MKEELLDRYNKAAIYKLLADCYYILNKEQVITINNFELKDYYLYEKIIAEIPKEDNEEKIKSLQVDYSRLFVGPYKLLAPPYGSVYMENNREVNGQSTIDVQHWYNEEGLEIKLKDMPDHISYELEFMYVLISKEIDAWKDDDPETAFKYLVKQQNFLNTHLGSWINDFCEKVTSNAKTDFYKNIASCTNSFITSELVYYDMENKV